MVPSMFQRQNLLQKCVFGIMLPDHHTRITQIITNTNSKEAAFCTSSISLESLQKPTNPEGHYPILSHDI